MILKNIVQFLIKLILFSEERSNTKRTVGKYHIFGGLNAKNCVSWGNFVYNLRVLWVNFHICWNGACVKHLTNIMPAHDGGINHNFEIQLVEKLLPRSFGAHCSLK